MPQQAALQGVPFTLQNAQASGNGAVLAIPPSLTNHRLTVNFGAGTSAGAVQWETADSPTFAGTWQAIGSPIAWAAASSEVGASYQGALQFIRARISTAIVGGTVTVSYLGTLN